MLKWESAWPSGDESQKKDSTEDLIKMTQIAQKYLFVSLSLKDQTILHIEGQNCLAKIQEILNILSLHSASCHEPHGHTWLSQGIELLSDLTYLC